MIAAHDAAGVELVDAPPDVVAKTPPRQARVAERLLARASSIQPMIAHQEPVAGVVDEQQVVDLRQGEAVSVAGQQPVVVERGSQQRYVGRLALRLNAVGQLLAVDRSAAQKVHRAGDDPRRNYAPTGSKARWLAAGR